LHTTAIIAAVTAAAATGGGNFKRRRKVYGERMAVFEREWTKRRGEKMVKF